MKILSLIFYFLLPLISAGQLTTNVEWTTETSLPAADVITYSVENKLNWGDFLGKPNTDNSRVAAVTMSGFGYTASISSGGGRGELNIKVYCFFNKKRSWVRSGRTTAYILNHEQHHFDISYIAASIFIDKIQAAVITGKNYNEILSRVYDECIESMNKMQEEYDGQTRNGQEKNLQEKWDQFIGNKMDVLTK